MNVVEKYRKDKYTVWDGAIRAMIEAFELLQNFHDEPNIKYIESETTGEIIEYILDDFTYKLKYPHSSKTSTLHDGNKEDLQNFIVGYVYHGFWKKFQTYTGISKDKYEKDEVYLDPILYQIELMLQDLMKLIFVKK